MSSASCPFGSSGLMTNVTNPLHAMTTLAVAINHSSRTRGGRSPFSVAGDERIRGARQTLSVKSPFLDAPPAFVERSRPPDRRRMVRGHRGGRQLVGAPAAPPNSATVPLLPAVGLRHQNEGDVGSVGHCTLLWRSLGGATCTDINRSRYREAGNAP